MSDLVRHDEPLSAFDSLSVEHWPDELLWQAIEGHVKDRNDSEIRQERGIDIAYVAKTRTWVAWVQVVAFDELWQSEERAEGDTIHDALVALARAVLWDGDTAGERG